MEIMKNKIGVIVTNDGRDLADTLDLKKLHHMGNYIFEGNYRGLTLIITTEPQDEDGELIKVTDIRIDRHAIHKVCITYHMIRGRETAETCIDLPISAERYEELAKGLTEQGKVWRSIQESLKQLTFLQGYNELGSWSAELTIITE